MDKYYSSNVMRVLLSSSLLYKQPREKTLFCIPEEIRFIFSSYRGIFGPSHLSRIFLRNSTVFIRRGILWIEKKHARVSIEKYILQK